MWMAFHRNNFLCHIKMLSCRCWLPWIISSAAILNVLADESCCKYSKTTLDCGHCNLTSLPLTLMMNTTTELLLDHNRISHVPNNSFINMKSLRKLTLTENILQNLNANTFRGLELLSTLELGIYDSMTLSPLPSEVFQPFGNVRNLRLLHRYQDEISPASFKFMPNLERLTFSMGSKGLGCEFRTLRKLKSLQVVEIKRKNNNESLTEISQRTFANIPQIEELNIPGYAHVLHTDFLKAFRNLTALSLQCGKKKQKISDIISAIKKQKKPTLRKLVLDSTYGDGLLSFDANLFNSTNLAKITYLCMRNTHITTLDALSNLPSLKYIAFGDNIIMMDDYEQGIYSFLQNINKMHLESLDVNNLNTKPKPTCKGNFHIQDFFLTPPEIIQPLKLLDAEQFVVASNQTISGDKIIFKFPPSLQYIYATHIDFTPLFESSSKISAEFNLDNNALYIDISNTNFNKDLPLLTGLVKLQGIDISHIGLRHIHPHQLAHFPSLTYLSAHHNNLQNIDLPAFMEKGVTLKWLDLGYNYYLSIPHHSFIKQTSIEHLSLQGNPLVTVMLDLQSNTKLKSLDISNCALMTLPDAFLSQLDQLQSKINHSLSLNVSSNRFECSCNTISMVEWFNKTEVNVIEREHITCTYNNKTMSIIDVDYNTMVKECQHASPASLLPVSLSLSVVLPATTTALMLVVGYHFRWHLKWYAYKLRCRIRLALMKQNLLTVDENGFKMDRKYHAFISYNHQEDYEWIENVLYPVVEEEWELKLCIGHRDFIVGKPIIDNIVEAIDNSQWTILVVTPAFVRSEWCEFELQMALTRGQYRIVILYKEEVSAGDMSKTLRVLMRNVTYIEYDAQDDTLFWQQLKKCLTQRPKK